MEWLGLVIFIGILTLLLIAALYLGKTQKTPSLPRPSRFTLNASHHGEGIPTAFKTLEKLDERSSRERRRHPLVQYRQRKYRHEWLD